MFFACDSWRTELKKLDLTFRVVRAEVPQHATPCVAAGDGRAQVNKAIGLGWNRGLLVFVTKTVTVLVRGLAQAFWDAYPLKTGNAARRQRNAVVVQRNEDDAVVNACPFKDGREVAVDLLLDLADFTHH